jgi:predicted  nucleic acid-binding Zn-ribbon protein
MALFGSKRKRGKKSQAADPAAAATTVALDQADSPGTSEVTGIPAIPPEAPARKGIQGTLERLVTLHGSRARLKQLCAETLKLILDAFGVQHGALLLYDPRAQCLLLAAGKGLGTEGQERLRRVRYNDPLSWDMPLRALLNESAYLIDDPGQNRYVPKLVDRGNGTLVRIAVIPLYRQRSPIGAFVLLAEKGERLAEAEIHLAHVSLQYVGTIIDDAQQREGLGSLGGEKEEGVPSGSDAVSAKAVRKRKDVRPVAHGEAADAEPAPSKEEATPFTARADDVPSHAQHGISPEAFAALEARAFEANCEVERLRSELAAALAEIERHSGDWEEESDRAVAAVRDELGDDDAQTLALVEDDRDRLAARVAELTESIESQRAELQGLEATRAERAQLTERVAELTSLTETQQSELRVLAAVRAERDELARRLAQASESADAARRSESTRDDARMRELEAELTAVRENAQETATQLQAVQGELEARDRRIGELEADRGRLAAEAATVRESLAQGGDRSDAVEALLETRTAEIESLSSRLAAAEAKVEARGRAIHELKTAATGLKTDRMAARDELSRLSEHARSLEATIERKTAELADLSAQLDGVRAQSEARESAIVELRARTDRLEQERAAAQQDVQALRAEIDGGTGREQSLRETLERVRGESRVREEQLQGDVTRAARERDALQGRVAELETAARVGTERLQAVESVAHRAAEEAQRRERELREQLAALEQAVQDARGHGADAEARAESLRSENERLQGEATALNRKVADLERLVLDATARAEKQRAAAAQESTALQAAADAAQADATALRAQLEELQARLGRGSREDLEANVARLEANYRAAFSEAALLREEAAKNEERVKAVEAERDQQAAAVAKLEAAVARLEAERVIRSQRKGEADDRSAGEAVASDESGEQSRRGAGKGASETAAKADTKAGKGHAKRPSTGGSGVPGTERLVIVEPTAAVGSTMAAKLGDNVQVVAPSANLESVIRKVEATQATVVAINLGARTGGGGFHLLQALARSDAAGDVRIWAYIAPPQATKAIALGFVNWMAQPKEAKEFIGTLTQLCGRSERVLTVGLETEGLLSARDELKKHGLSLSMAWDSKQGQELLEMVNPSTVVVNLDLPRGDGYRALGRLGGTEIRHRWILCGGEGPPAEAASLVVTGATQRSATDGFLKFADVPVALLEDLNSSSEGAEDGETEPTRGRSRDRSSGTPPPPPRSGASGPLRAVISGGRRNRR